MTLRRRWTVSILAILGLFGLNLAAYFWGNARRGEIMGELKTALERKELAVEIRNLIEDREREAEVMEPLLASGAVRLTGQELAEIGERTEEIGRSIDRLHALSEELSGTMLLVMRAYFEKPRTAVGWKGFINDPDLDDFEVARGRSHAETR